MAWNLIPCLQFHPECEVGYTRFGGNCYKTETYDMNLLSALQTCQLQNSSLWAPRQQGEEIAIPGIFGYVITFILQQWDMIISPLISK